MGGRINCGMAMHDQRAMIARIIKEDGPDPQKIILGLVKQRHSGADTGMDKDQISPL